MTDPAHFVRPLDPGRVNSTDPLELEYWCRELGCSLAELETTIEQVGEHVTAVREALHRARPGSA